MKSITTTLIIIAALAFVSCEKSNINDEISAEYEIQATGQGDSINSNGSGHDDPDRGED